MELIKIIGMNIRMLRKRKNLTIEELAEKCELQVPYLSDVERGERNITIQTLSKILNALESNPAAVLIPNPFEENNNEDSKYETIKLISNILHNKTDSEIQMILNVINEIFKVYENK